MSDDKYSASRFKPQLLERALNTVASYLIEHGELDAASVVINSVPTLGFAEWQPSEGEFWTLFLGLPPATLAGLEGLGTISDQIDRAVSAVLEQFPGTSFNVTIGLQLLEENDDWRIIAQRRLTGEGITNQGRVRSDNIAALSHNGLLFRSRPETLMYDAFKRRRLVFTPLPTVLTGNDAPNSRKRIEPDFLLIYEGILLCVEVDGDFTHPETPLQAQERVEPLTRNGVRVERVPAPKTPDEASATADRVVSLLKRMRAART